jgi:hypothetical protein
MKTFVKTCILLLSLLILSETALAGCPGGVCPNRVGRSYSRNYRSYGSPRAYYGRSYGVYAGVGDCGAPSSYGVGAVGYESVNHRESTHVGIFGRTHTHVKHHHHRHVTPVVTP